uniref:Peptidase A2 domain-containing protein n=1 Tax=Panagrolaimus sp. ES5 TaxID=591445 RepID=A0AC34F0X0_9BILA
MVGLFDRSESIFAKRYALFQTEWKGPEHEPIAEYCSRVRESVSAIDPTHFGATEIETMVLLMGIKHPALEVFRLQVLNLLNKDAKTTLAKCQEAMTATFQTHQEQRLPMGTSINYVKHGSYKHPHSKREERNQSSCSSCGVHHARDTCRFRNAICRFCNVSGHIEKVCRKKYNNRRSFSGSDSSRANSSDRNRRPAVKDSHPRVSNIQMNDAPQPTTAAPAYPYSSKTLQPWSGNVRLLNVRVDGTSSFSSTPPAPSSSNARLMVDVRINDEPLLLQLDTGADVTVLSMDDYKKLGEPNLNGPATTATVANNTSLSLLGSFQAAVVFKDESEAMDVFVADIPISLLGLDFHHVFQLDQYTLRDIIRRPSDAYRPAKANASASSSYGIPATGLQVTSTSADAVSSSFGATTTACAPADTTLACIPDAACLGEAPTTTHADVPSTQSTSATTVSTITVSWKDDFNDDLRVLDSHQPPSSAPTIAASTQLRRPGPRKKKKNCNKILY